MLDDSWIEKLYAAKPKKDNILIKEPRHEEVSPQGNTLDAGIERQTDKLVDF